MNGNGQGGAGGDAPLDEDSFDHAGATSGPLDPGDPRYVGEWAPAFPPAPRRLVRSQGPGTSAHDPRVRLLRGAVPLLAVVGVAVVAAVFAVGLAPRSHVQPVGSEHQARAAVREAPRRVCLHGNNPCAWLTLVDGELLALHTSGPLAAEYGRSGVAWCASSGWFGSNVTGSRFDARGHVVRGPAPRGLDRFALVRRDGLLAVDFGTRTAGLPPVFVADTTPARGPDCEEIPYDWDADLEG